MNEEGAQNILNTTVDLIASSHCKLSDNPYLPRLTNRLQVPVVEFIADSYPTGFLAVFWPLMPLSRGHIHIASSDPFENPIITPRLLTDDFDEQVAVTVARRAGTLYSSAPFADVVAEPYYDPPLGPNSTDAEYLTWYKNTAFGASHWIGATAMMPRELGGVVDSRLQ